VKPDHVLVDGNPIRTLGVEHTAVVAGDACCHSIACASIVAKVTRDRLMHALARRYPHYRWETNVGYGTSDHHAGLAAHGLTPHHRRSFTPIAQLSLPFGTPPTDETSSGEVPSGDASTGAPLSGDPSLVADASLVDDALRDILHPEPLP
jgi:hypothetical protein